MDKREWNGMKASDAGSEREACGGGCMDKRKFLEELRTYLADLTDEERGEALDYYEEYFADAGEENEGDVILSLGTPKQVAEQIKAGFHSEEEGMFTENGYQEKIESDNPPEVYGRKTERQRDRGPLPWMRGKRKSAGFQNASKDYSQSGRAYGSSGDPSGEAQKKEEHYAGGYGAEGYHANNYNRNGQSGYDYGRQSGYGYTGQRAGEKKEGMSGGMIALLVVLGVLASPVILGLGAGLFGAVVGIFGAVLGVIAALFAVVIAMLAAGVGLLIAGFAALLVRPFGGMLCIAAGCFLIALFLVCAVLLVGIFSKFFPWLIREVEGIGKYLSRKWSEKKGKGEAA